MSGPRLILVVGRGEIVNKKSKISTGMTNQVAIMEMVQPNGLTVSVLARARKGRKFKWMRDLLSIMRVAKPSTEARKDVLPHPQGGDQVLEPLSDKWIEGQADALALELRQFFMKIWNLSPSKFQRKWSILLSLVVTNSEGIVVYDRCFLNWTADKVGDYLTISRKTRKLHSLEAICKELALPEKTNK